MQTLSVKGLGLAIGIVWSCCNLLAGWAAMFGWGGKYVDLMSSIYIGYHPTWVGGLIGAAWAFVDGCVGGILIAIIYNRVTRPSATSGN